jgi:hypothetical protein
VQRFCWNKHAAIIAHGCNLSVADPTPQGSHGHSESFGGFWHAVCELFTHSFASFSSGQRQSGLGVECREKGSSLVMVSSVRFPNGHSSRQ